MSVTFSSSLSLSFSSISRFGRYSCQLSRDECLFWRVPYLSFPNVTTFCFHFHSRLIHFCFQEVRKKDLEKVCVFLSVAAILLPGLHLVGNILRSLVFPEWGCSWKRSSQLGTCLFTFSQTAFRSPILPLF